MSHGWSDWGKRCLFGCSGLWALALVGCGAGSFGLFKALEKNDDEPFIPLSTASIDEAAVLLSPDRFRGIPIPYALSPEGRVPADAVIQWRFEADSAFPALPDSTDEIRAALRNPALASRLQICSESPSAAEGFISCLPDPLPDDGRSVRILGIGDLESWALTEGILGQEMQILRASDRPFLSGVTSRGPRGFVPIDEGIRAVVLDEATSSGLRLREVDLGTGAVVRTIIESGPQGPLAMIPLGVERVVIVTGDGIDWTMHEVELRSGDILQSRSRPADAPQGEVRDLVSLGGRSILFTVGDSLVEWTLPEDTGASVPDPVVHCRGLSLPHGLAVDSDLGRRGVYVAERAANRISRINLLARTRQTLVSVSSPSALTLSPETSTLLILTDDAAIAGMEVLGLALHRATLDGDSPWMVAQGIPGREGGLFVGPDNLRVISSRDASEIWIAGGVEQSRIVDSFDPRFQVARVDRDFDPPLRVEQPRRWRILDRVRAVVGSTRREVFVWNSADAKSSGRVVLGITPIDNRKGVTTEIRVGKEITSAIDVEGVEIERVDGDLFIDPRSLDVEDVDRDGDLDVLVVSKLDDSLVVVPQSEPGILDVDNAISLNAGLDGPGFVDVADFDGDEMGLLDIAVTNEGSQEIVIFQQQPDLSFASTNLAIDGFARTARWANVNPVDDELELVVGLVDGTGTEGRVLIIDPDGADLGAVSSITLSLDKFPVSVEAADIDGDSRLDLVVIVCVDAACSFAPPDWDGVSQGECLVLYQGAGLDFSDRVSLDIGPPSIGPTRPFALGVEDIDGDRDIDIAVGVATGLPSTDRIRLFLNTGEGVDGSSFIDFEGDGINGPTSVSMVDMNGDGARDLVISNFGGSRVQDPGEVSVIFQPGDGFPADEDGLATLPFPNTILRAPTMVNALQVLPVDLNGDTALDLVAISENSDTNADPTEAGSLAMFLAKDPGDYQSPPEFFGVEGVLRNPSLAAGDFNGDGALDLVTANASSAIGGEPEGGNSLTVFLQEFLGRIDPAADVIRGETGTGFPLQNPFDVVATDLDGDGRQDLAVVARDGDNLAIYLQTEPGSFDDPLVLVSDELGLKEPIAIAAGDVDCDGDVDLVVAVEGEGGRVIVLTQLSPGDFCTRSECGAMVLDSPMPNDVLVADVTGDGQADIIVANRSGIRVFDLDDDEGGNPILLETGTVDPMSITAGDLDRDGRLDIAATNRGDDALLVFFQGRFDNPRIIRDPQMMGESFVALADVNSDGLSDIVVANRRQDGSLTVVRQISDGIFGRPKNLFDPALTLPRGILPVDLDRDSDIDLVVPINRDSGDGILVFFGGQ